MKIRPVVKIVGAINIVVAAAMLVPLGVALLYGDGDALFFLYSIAIALVVGGAMFLSVRGGKYEIGHREGFLVVAFSWITASLSCAIPFIISGYFPSFVDAVFEAVSGITTTGASVLNDIEGLPHGLLFWRSMIHWLGGIGIVVLSLAILPLLGVGGMQLYKAEFSVISSDKFAPRIKEMVRIILAVYLVLSVSLTVILLLLGMGPFDALTHMFSTVATAGYSTRAASIGAYNSVYIEAVIIFFMFISATSFALHYRFVKEGFKVFTESPEFKFYFFVTLGAVVLVAISLALNGHGSIFKSFRDSAFQVVSVITTTGFSTVDFGIWPAFGQTVLLALMFMGGCVGSTTGSMKAIRILLMIKMGYKEIYRLIHPHAVIPLKLGGRVVPREVLRGVMGFTILFLLAFVLSSALLAWQGADLVTAISSAASTITNFGPALGQAGPMSNFAFFPDLSKWILILNMLLGRLEIYALIIIFVPAFWRG